jgi:MoxR-like ATPase
MQADIEALQQKLQAITPQFNRLTQELQKVIVGQQELLRCLVVALLADGHVLLEGVPGLAKTLSISTLARAIDAQFQRIQFTPDLLPADLIGTRIYNPQRNEFEVRRGPLFTQLLLADEINRAPAKVQSALLEAMQERQVTISQETWRLDAPFLVLATQNPLEQEGTYPLPEAQLDRFMLKTHVGYPTPEEEIEIVTRMTSSQRAVVQPVLNAETILMARNLIAQIYLDDKIKRYIVDLVVATRDPERYRLDMKNLIRAGASPRASIYLAQAARVQAFLAGRAFVIPEDVKRIALEILRHRVSITYEAEAQEISTDQLVQQIIERVKVP